LNIFTNSDDLIFFYLSKSQHNQTEFRDLGPCYFVFIG